MSYRRLPSETEVQRTERLIRQCSLWASEFPVASPFRHFWSQEASRHRKRLQTLTTHRDAVAVNGHGVLYLADDKEIWCAEDAGDTYKLTLVHRGQVVREPIIVTRESFGHGRMKDSWLSLESLPGAWCRLLIDGEEWTQLTNGQRNGLITMAGIAQDKAKGLSRKN
ncbi:MAG: hypothetical protein J0H02_13905 [Armatimonadetes bacterium]|nr:hypothetical protein [Armatimonadota bacterium]